MNKVSLTLLLVSFLSLSTYASEEVIFIGADENGVSSSKISLTDYKKVISASNDSFKEHVEENYVEKRNLKSSFNLTRIVVGAGASFSVGSGPWKAGLAIRQRFYYKKK